MPSKVKLYFRGRSRRKILPVTGADGENSVQQVGNYLPTKTRQNPNQGRIYDADGISPCLNSMEGGGREPSVGIKVIGTSNPDMHSVEDVHADDEIMSCLTSGDYKSPKKVGIKILGQINSSQDGKIHDIAGIAKCHSAGHNNSPKVAIPCDIKCININDKNGKERPQQDRVYDITGNMTALSAQLGGRHNVSIPVSTPEISNKNQNGRRFKENGEPMFTLTAQDRHGVGIGLEDICFDLKAFSSKTRGKAERIGHAATLDHNCNQGVIGGIYTNVSPEYQRGICEGLSRGLKANKHDSAVVLDISGKTPKQGDGIYVELPQGFTVYAVWYEKYQCYIAIRRLTPKECFRLQGWTDDYFEKAAFVNSDSQLYKQAGNQVTVPVVETIGKKIAE